MSRRPLENPAEDMRLAHEIEGLTQVEPLPGLEARMRHRVGQREPRPVWVMPGVLVLTMAVAAALLILVAGSPDGSVAERALTPTQQVRRSPQPGPPARLPDARGDVPGPVPPAGASSYRAQRSNERAGAVSVPVGLIPARESEALHVYLRSLSVEPDALFESAVAGVPEETAAGSASAAIAIAPLDIELLADVVPLSGEAE